jgi:hypothetical protein
VEGGGGAKVGAGAGAAVTGWVGPVSSTETTGAVPPFAGMGAVEPFGATGPVSSGRARRVIRTVSFFNGTVDVLVDGFRGSGVCGSVSLMIETF